MGEAKRRGTFEERRREAILNHNLGRGGNMNHHGIPMRPMPMQQQINLDANDTIEKRCECGCDLFQLVYRYRVLPSVSAKNPTGKDVPIKVEAFVCDECGRELGKKAENNVE